MRLIQYQTDVSPDKEKNLDNMAACMADAAARGADMAAFGEMFACPYEAVNFPKYAEPAEGPSWQRFSALARKYRMYLSAGSIPEIDEEGHVFNTAYVFDRDGRQVARHAKTHLFDIDVKGGQRFFESDTLTPGPSFGAFDTEFGKMGLMICFDVRFPELARIMALEGARLILVPAAFNMTTGPAHWTLHMRARALDNQCFVAATSVARDMEASYHAWGHSMVTDPWGSVISELDERAGSLLTDIDFGRVEEVRAQLPLLSARRTDLYDLSRA